MSTSAEPAHRDKRPKLDEYAELDKRINNDNTILELRKEFGKQLPKSFFSSLLYVIKEHSGRGQWEGLRSLAQREDLIPIIRACWESKSYREVLESGCFPLSSPPVQHTTSGPRKHKDYYTQLLWEAWQVPFQGDYHSVLFENINRMYYKGLSAHICPVIQSSGTGKSRMVDEQAKLVYTLPINIRDDSGAVAVYPPADRMLRSHLVYAPTDRPECRTYYVTFFRSLFRRAAEELSTLDLTNNDPAEAWYNKMADPEYRRGFYEDVVRLCYEQKPGPNARKELEVLISKLDKLRQTTDKIKVVIYIDEAHELRNSTDGDTKLDALYWPPIRLFAPPMETAFSERARQVALMAPITETPYDCAPGIKVKAGVLRVEDLYKVDRITKWGRPLWWTGRDSIDVLLDFARVKLLCSHDVDNGCIYDVKRPALAAILDVLLAFKFDPSHTRGNDIEAEMVKCHMRIAYSIPSPCVFFESGYPSEPLLAEAAAQQLWVFHKYRQEFEEITSFDSMERVLEYALVVSRSLIDVEHGGLAMRMFLTRAHMDGVLEEAELENKVTRSGIVFSRGCSLLTFIEELFKSEQAEKILGALPDNVINKTTFTQSFANAMVRFTHFVRAGDEYAFTSEALCAAFIRGAAVIAHKSQKLVDLAVPILLDREDMVRESNVSALLIQVGRHIKGSGPTKHTFSERDVNLFPADENAEAQKRPYIVLVAKLDMAPEEGQVGKIKTPCVHVLQQPKRQTRAEDTHLRYNFVAYGGSLYKDVSAEQCAKLLTTVEEHPRKESRNLMMRLKPIWEEGEDTYHWFEREDQPESVEQGVVEQVVDSDESSVLSDV